MIDPKTNRLGFSVSIGYVANNIYAPLFLVEI